MEYPRRRSDVGTEILDDQSILVDPENGDFHILNSTGSVVWDLCDGTRSVSEVSQTLASVYGIDADRASEDVTHLVQTLVEAGLLKDERDES